MIRCPSIIVELLITALPASRLSPCSACSGSSRIIASCRLVDRLPAVARREERDEARLADADVPGDGDESRKRAHRNLLASRRRPRGSRRRLATRPHGSIGRADPSGNRRPRGLAPKALRRSLGRFDKSLPKIQLFIEARRGGGRKDARLTVEGRRASTASSESSTLAVLMTADEHPLGSIDPRETHDQSVKINLLRNNFTH